MHTIRFVGASSMQVAMVFQCSHLFSCSCSCSCLMLCMQLSLFHMQADTSFREHATFVFFEPTMLMRCDWLFVARLDSRCDWLLQLIQIGHCVNSATCMLSASTLDDQRSVHTSTRERVTLSQRAKRTRLLCTSGGSSIP